MGSFEYAHLVSCKTKDGIFNVVHLLVNKCPQLLFMEQFKEELALDVQRQVTQKTIALMVPHCFKKCVEQPGTRLSKQESSCIDKCQAK